MELWRYGASELATLMAKRDVSCAEVVQAHVDRIDVVNAQVKALTAVLADEALATAEHFTASPVRSSDRARCSVSRSRSRRT